MFVWWWSSLLPSQAVAGPLRPGPPAAGCSVSRGRRAAAGRRTGPAPSGFGPLRGSGPCLSGPLAPLFAPAFRFGSGSLVRLGCSPRAAARRRGGVLDPGAPGSVRGWLSARRVVVGAAPRLSPGLRWPPKGHPAIGGRPHRRGAVPPSGCACFPPGGESVRRLANPSSGRFHRSRAPVKAKASAFGGLDGCPSRRGRLRKRPGPGRPTRARSHA